MIYTDNQIERGFNKFYLPAALIYSIFLSIHIYDNIIAMKYLQEIKIATIWRFTEGFTRVQAAK